MPQSRDSYWDLVGSVLALASAVAYSAMYFLVRAGVRKGDLDGGAFVTTLVNAVLLSTGVAILALTGHTIPWNVHGVVWLTIAGLLGTFSGRVLMLAGLRRIGPVRTASIVNSTPILTITISVLVLGEVLSGRVVIAAFLVLMGLSLLAVDAFETPDPTLVGAGRRPGPAGSTPLEAPRARSTTPAVVGLGLSALSALSFGTARVARRVGLSAIPDPLAGAMVGACAALVSNLVLQAGQGRLSTVVVASLRDVRPTLWLAGVASTIGLLSFFLALQFSPLSHVAVIASSETVITMMMSWLLFRRREALSGRILIAATCVFSAGVLTALG